MAYFKSYFINASESVCLEFHWFILGGGTGQSIRTYGLACDQLLGLTMVDYQGNIIQASMTENTDLLWASCGGGGGNLGIVTSFTVKMLSLNDVPFVTTATLSWTGYDTAVSIFDKVTIIKTQPIQNHCLKESLHFDGSKIA